MKDNNLKGTVRVKAVSTNPDDKLLNGFLTVLKQQMGPLEFKSLVKQLHWERNKQLVSSLTKQKQLAYKDTQVDNA